MRVLVVGLSRYSAPTGICRYADMTCRALSGVSGIHTSLLIGSWQEHYFRKILDSTSHSNVMSVEVRNNPFSRNAWYTIKLPAIARDLGADVVHFAYPVPFVRKLHCPTVVTVHDMYPFEVPENFRFAAANRGFLKLCLRRCDAIICISHTTLEALTRFLPHVAKSRFLTQNYNPINRLEVVAGQKPLAKLESGMFLLTVGQHRRNKNLDLLQRTFASLRANARIPMDWKLAIVGSEDRESTELKALTRELRLESHVLYLSSITDSEIAWLYRNCAIAAFPSAYEGLCMPVVEALLTGAKVVCSDIPTLREVGMNACTYFQLQYQPVEAFARAISAAMLRPTEPVRTWDHFSPSSVAQQISQVYRSVVSAPNGS